MTGDPLNAKARWWARIRRGTDITSVSYRDHTLQFRDRAGQILASIPSTDIASIRPVPGVFGNELIVTSKTGERWSVGALKKSESREIRQAFIEYRRIVQAVPRARELTPQIKIKDQEVKVFRADLIAGKKYLGRTQMENLLSDIKRLISQCDLYVRRSFSKETKAALNRIEALDGDELEKARRSSNQVYQRRMDAEPLARKLSPQIGDADKRVADLLSGKKYLRRTEMESLLSDIKRLISQCDHYVRRSFSEDTNAALQRISGFDFANMEQARRTLNQQYVKRAVRLIKAETEDVLHAGLTDEQATAVATDEDVTLVLAGAGTGKTEVIASKAANLVRNQGVSPGEILVLAFNKKTAAEIRERLPGHLRGVEVCTFHAFGRHVIAQSTGKQPTVSRLAEDRVRLKNAVSKTLDEMLDSPRYQEMLLTLLAYHRNQYQSPFDFKSADEYFRYVYSIERRTLSGDLMRSLEEVQVANLLSLNGVEFEYEKPYQVDTASTRHRQYRPDFYLPKHDIYIEHFALDEAGNPPVHFRNYKKGVEWKRSIHKQHGTTLIETHSWQCRTGVLQSELAKNLRHVGVELGRVPLGDLLEQLRRLQHNWLAGLIATFLRHVKTSRVSPSELRRRAAGSKRNNAFLDVFEEVRDRYERMLGEEGAVDFEDLINRATEHIGSGHWAVPYRYVLVDEFQDISAGRMALIAALRRTGTAYFLVGDDWQSINRFAGSDVGLVRDCGNYLGYVCECHLGTTFRYRAGILDPSAAFVQRNPEQTQRRLRTTSTAPDHGITVVVEAPQKAGVRTALNHIRHREARSLLTLAKRTFPCLRSADTDGAVRTSRPNGMGTLRSNSAPSTVPRGGRKTTSSCWT